MEFEESLAFDFRAKSLTALIGRLEELHAALNLSASFYTVRRPVADRSAQLSLIPSGKKVLLVVGAKCAGKTTFGDHLLAEYEGSLVLEASSILRELAAERDIDIADSDDALHFLKANGMASVAERIADYIERADSELSVVTGLRTVEEIRLLCQRFSQARIVLVTCDARIRFERHIRRARDVDVKTFKAFQQQDAEQLMFGALRVANDLADAIIENDGAMEQYRRKIDDLLNSLGNARGHAAASRSMRREKSSESELHRCLRALQLIGRPATCAEIAEKTKELGIPVRPYNTNRALKAVPEFAERLTRRRQLLSYRLLPQGRLLLDLLDTSLKRRSATE